jgi:hypothetical protein
MEAGGGSRWKPELGADGSWRWESMERRKWAELRNGPKAKEDNIHGMDWLSKYDGVIQCTRKAVKLTKKDGTSFEFVAMVQSDQDSVLNQTKAIALEDIRVV